MTTFTDELKLVITVDPSGAVSVLKGFGQEATGDLAKVQSAAGASGNAAGSAYSTNFQQTALLGLQAVQSAIATLGIAAFVKSAVSDADAFARVNVQLAAQLDATGAAAGASADGVNELAASLQKTQDVYAGTIKQGAALLLTFTQIQNQPGQGNDIFNRALTDATAVSNVFQRDLPSSIAQLGRALEDPLTGIISLQKGGLAISEQDKIRVRDLAKQGDLLGSQKALLDAIEAKGLVAAGAAAGQGDPIQRFNTEMETLKVTIGKDFLPLLKLLDTGLEDTFGAFSAIPTPVRATIEVLGAAGIAALAVTGTILALKNAYGALKAVQLIAAGGGGGGTGAETAEVESLAVASGNASEEVAVLDAELAAANEQLSLFGARFAVAADGMTADLAVLSETTEQLALFDIELVDTIAVETSATESTGLFAAALASLSGAAASTGASLAAIGPLGAIGAIGAGFAAFTITYTALKAVVGANNTPFAQLSTDGAKLTTDLGTLTKQSEQLKSSNPFESIAFPIKGVITLFGGLAHSSQQATHDIKEANDGLKEIAATQGPVAAQRAFRDMQSAIEAAGGSASTFAQYMGPALDAIHAAAVALREAQSGAEGFAEQFAALAGTAVSAASDLTSLEQSFEAIAEAQKKVANDNADIAGTGPEVVAAVANEKSAYEGLVAAVDGVANAKQRLSDAYHSLDDAQQRVTSSARDLLEAQQALDLFNSPRGVLERQLKLDILERRVVTTPAEEDQKRLDILQEQDSNQKKSQDLQDSVNDKQHAYADALYAVGKASRDVTDAQKGVETATNNVEKAETKLQQAIEKRKTVSRDARDALVKDQLAVDAAFEATSQKLITMAQNGELVNDSWLKGLKAVADELLPNGDFKKALDNALAESILTYELSQQRPSVDANGADRGRVLRGQANNPAGPTTGSGLPPDIVKLLQGLGIPGFASDARSPAASGATHASSPPTAGASRAGGGVTIHQTNHFNGEAATAADLRAANTQLAWGVARTGRGS